MRRAPLEVTLPIAQIYRTTPDAVYVQHESTGAAVWVPREHSEPLWRALRIPRWLYRKLRPALRPPFTTA